MTWSVSARLLVAAGAVLAGFFGVTGTVLDRAYYRDADEALRDRLEGYAYTLIAASAVDRDGGVQVAHPVPEVRFFQPGAGLYARMVSNDGRHRWRSPSMGEADIPFPRGLRRSQRRFEVLALPDGSRVLSFSMGVAWEARAEGGEVYTVSVAEDLAAFDAQIAGYRRILWSWLGLVGVVLLIAQSLILRWGLAPLRRVAADLLAIERGAKLQLDEDYPRELRGLTANLNALVRHERDRRERFRRVLGDLAHSLKTPLAVLRGASEGGQQDEAALRPVVREQVGRMSQIVEHQLQRAGASGRSPLHRGEPVEEVARKMVDALDKVYADKGVRCRLELAPGMIFHGDRGDLMEILGNLMDNAYKWCRATVVVTIRARTGDRPGAPGLCIQVADDGPGVPQALRERVLERGARAGGGRAGQGIGLAVVRDIAELYGGQVTVRDSGLGGALVEVVV